MSSKRFAPAPPAPAGSTSESSPLRPTAAAPAAAARAPEAAATKMAVNASRGHRSKIMTRDEAPANFDHQSFVPAATTTTATSAHHDVPDISDKAVRPGSPASSTSSSLSVSSDAAGAASAAATGVNVEHSTDTDTDDDDDVVLLSERQLGLGRRGQAARERVLPKREDLGDGTLFCPRYPKCTKFFMLSQTNARGGCKILTCVHAHEAGDWNEVGAGVCFCCHCKTECRDVNANCDCINSSFLDARQEELLKHRNAQMGRNERAAGNPVDLMSAEEIGGTSFEASILPSASTSPSAMSTISSINDDVSSLTVMLASGSSSVATAPSVATVGIKREGSPVEMSRRNKTTRKRKKHVSYADDDDGSFLSPSGSSDGSDRENGVDFPPLPPLPDETVEIAEGALDATDYEAQSSRGAPSVDDASNAHSNEDFFRAGEDGDNDPSGGDDSGGAQPCVGIANPNGNENIARWNDRYFELIEYKGEHSDCNVPKKYEENKQLGTWVNHQRAHYRRLNKGKTAKITTERIAKLNEIGFVWSAQEAAWAARFAELVAYKEEHGDCNVPCDFKGNKQLGTWVDTQRAHYQQLKKGKKSSITNERIAKLNEIGFVWDAYEAAWTARFAELVAYKAKHGDCNVPKNEENKELGTWVNKQRAEYRLLMNGKSSTMTGERIAKLDEIGFKWRLK